jgi:hypothetical protein
MFISIAISSPAPVLRNVHAGVNASLAEIPIPEVHTRLDPASEEKFRTNVWKENGAVPIGTAPFSGFSPDWIQEETAGTSVKILLEEIENCGKQPTSLRPATGHGTST